MSTTSELVTVPKIEHKTSTNNVVEGEESIHVSTLDLKKDLNIKKDLENGVVNDCNNINGVKDGAENTNHNDVDMKEDVNHTEDSIHKNEVNGISDSVMVDENNINDVEMDDEDKLLIDTESVDSSTVNDEESLLKSDDEDDIENYNDSSIAIPNGDSKPDLDEDDNAGGEITFIKKESDNVSEKDVHEKDSMSKESPMDSDSMNAKLSDSDSMNAKSSDSGSMNTKSSDSGSMNAKSSDSGSMNTKSSDSGSMNAKSSDSESKCTEQPKSVDIKKESDPIHITASIVAKKEEVTDPMDVDVKVEKEEPEESVTKDTDQKKVDVIDIKDTDDKTIVSNDENIPPLDDSMNETEEERRHHRLTFQVDRVENLKDELRSEEATLSLLRKLLDSQRGKNGYKSSSKPQAPMPSLHAKPPQPAAPKSSAPVKQAPAAPHKPPPAHNASQKQPVQKYYIQVGNQLVPAPPPGNTGSGTVYQYTNGTTPHSTTPHTSYQTPPQPSKPAPPPKQTPEQKKNAAKAALRRQLEQTLLQIPPPRPPPADWKAVPNVNSMDFMMLVGLDEVVDTILDLDHKPTLKKALEDLTPYNPRICSQCKVDFSPCWKAAKDNNLDGFVLCERCALQNVKKELKAEHTSRLKSAFMKALKQEQEIEEKIKAGEDVNIANITGTEKQESQSSANHSPNTPQHQPSNRISSPKLAIAVPPQQSSSNHAPSPPERHHQSSTGHHHRHQVVQHYPHHTSLVQQLHHQHIQQQQLELEPSPRHSSRWHPYMSSSSNHHREHHPVHHRSYVPSSSSSTPVGESSPHQEYYVVHHPHQNVRYVTR